MLTLDDYHGSPGDGEQALATLCGNDVLEMKKKQTAVLHARLQALNIHLEDELAFLRVALPWGAVRLHPKMAMSPAFMRQALSIPYSGQPTLMWVGAAPKKLVSNICDAHCARGRAHFERTSLPTHFAGA